MRIYGRGKSTDVAAGSSEPLFGGGATRLHFLRGCALRATGPLGFPPMAESLVGFVREVQAAQAPS